jgi:arabinofuranosyltransferase
MTIIILNDILKIVTGAPFYYITLAVWCALIARAAYESFFKAINRKTAENICLTLVIISVIFAFNLIPLIPARLAAEFTICFICFWTLKNNGLFRQKGTYAVISFIFICLYGLCAVIMTVYFKPFALPVAVNDTQAVILYIVKFIVDASGFFIKTFFAVYAFEIMLKESEGKNRDDGIWMWPAGAVLVIYILVVLRTAWVSDDAFITFRTADNLVSGLGPVWNAGERVQAYTNPLWMLIFAFFHFFTREAYYTSLAISVFIDILLVICIFKFIKDKYTAVLIFIALMISRAFIDYSTSGLENPLTNLILAIGLIPVIEDKNGPKLSFFAVLSAVFLNRMDIILMVLPLAIYFIYIFFYKEKKNRFKKAGIIFLMLLPAVLWAVFSVIYYGFPFPNTFYAKQANDVSRFFYLSKGVQYFIESFAGDPVTPCAIFSGLILPFLFNKKKSVILRLVSAGTAAYLVYILFIGGDFMAGRLLAAPFMVSLLIIAFYLSKAGNKLKTVILIALIYLGSISAFMPVMSGANYRIVPNLLPGFTDERGFYYKESGLLRNIENFRKDPVNFNLQNLDNERKKQTKKGKLVFVIGCIGCLGYFSGPGAHIVDKYALADAFLARMKIDGKEFRVGHLSRMIPDGYIETIEQGKNMIKDHELAQYYDHMSVIIKGKIFSKVRFREIFNMNTGRYDYLLKGNPGSAVPGIKTPAASADKPAEQAKPADIY